MIRATLADGPPNMAFSRCFKVNSRKFTFSKSRNHDLQMCIDPSNEFYMSKITFSTPRTHCTHHVMHFVIWMLNILHAHITKCAYTVQILKYVVFMHFRTFQNMNLDPWDLWMLFRAISENGIDPGNDIKIDKNHIFDIFLTFLTFLTKISKNVKITFFKILIFEKNWNFWRFFWRLLYESKIDFSVFAKWHPFFTMRNQV